jgi:hypothetical protein
MKEKLMVEMLIINAITSGVIVGVGVLMYLMSGSLLKTVTVMSFTVIMLAFGSFLSRSDTWFAEVVTAVPAVFACSFYISSAHGGVDFAIMMVIALCAAAFAALSVKDSEELPYFVRYVSILPFFLGTIFGGLLLLDQRRHVSVA